MARRCSTLVDCGTCYQIVDKHYTSYDDVDLALVATSMKAVPANSFSCDVCKTASFATSKQLHAQMRKKLSIRNSVVQYIGDTSVCPVCRTDFRFRLRLISVRFESEIQNRAVLHGVT